MPKCAENDKTHIFARFMVLCASNPKLLNPKPQSLQSCQSLNLQVFRVQGFRVGLASGVFRISVPVCLKRHMRKEHQESSCRGLLDCCWGFVELKNEALPPETVQV